MCLRLLALPAPLPALSLLPSLVTALARVTSLTLVTAIKLVTAISLVTAVSLVSACFLVHRPPFSSFLLFIQTLLSFAVLPGNKMFAMPPEFIDPRYDKVDVTTNVANWVTSGLYLTTPASFMQFYYPFWELHPGSTASSAELGCTREETVKLWQKHTQLYGGLIPYEVHTASQKTGVRAQKGDDGGRTATEKKSGQKRKRGDKDKGPTKKKQKKKRASAGAQVQHATAAVVTAGIQADATDAIVEEDAYGGDDEAASTSAKRKTTVIPPNPSLPSTSLSATSRCTTRSRTGDPRVATSVQSHPYLHRYHFRDRPLGALSSESESEVAAIDLQSNGALLDVLGGYCADDDLSDSPTFVYVSTELTRAHDDNVDGQESGHAVDPDNAQVPSAPQPELQQELVAQGFIQTDQRTGHKRLHHTTNDSDEDMVVILPIDAHQPSYGRAQSRERISEARTIPSTPINRGITEEPQQNNGELHPGDPPYQKVLDIFALDSLRRQLRRYQKLEHRMTSMPSSSSSSELPINDFSRALCGDQSSTSFVQAVASMWQSYKTMKAASDVAELHLASVRRELMLCNAAAWYWLTQHCAARCRTIVAELIKNRAAFKDSDGWLERLCSHVLCDLAGRRAGPYQYHAREYLPQLPMESKHGTVSRPVHLEEDFGPRVCENVVRLLRPNNTEMLCEYFVMYIVAAFKNIDVLLLDGVWQAYRHIKASILGPNSTVKAPQLRVSHLHPFAAALTSLSLVTPTSQEAQTMDHISEIIERCLPGVKAWTSLLIGRLSTHNDIEEDPLYGAPQSFTSVSREPPTAVLPSAPPRTPQDLGLDALVEFALQMLPVALSHPIPHPTTLQSLAIDRPNHFLPFRELAPCRRRVSSRHGPYHATKVDLPGAFPSWLIFRALLFDSPVMRESTHCYFPDHTAWLAFLEEEGYDEGSNAALNRFFNVTCYGTPQNQRRAHGKQYAEDYFNAESQWTQLLAEHRGTVPFVTAFFWTQGYSMTHRDEMGKPCFRKLANVKFPLIGKLTGYLLAADLVYTGKVPAPMREELALVVRWNELGSLRGLHTASHLEKVGHLWQKRLMRRLDGPIEGGRNGPTTSAIKRTLDTASPYTGKLSITIDEERRDRPLSTTFSAIPRHANLSPWERFSYSAYLKRPGWPDPQAPMALPP
ncbi:hypothetical protein C8Q76DRAFT_788245 [Earliella scabrosa]|nr:hypothetical protein C8Q76DRAFT_788245 [Earliella scabrosa]